MNKKKRVRKPLEWITYSFVCKSCDAKISYSTQPGNDSVDTCGVCREETII